MSDVIRKRIRFYGRVQGVGFRYVASGAAINNRASGWVRNEYDGSVTMEIQGTAQQINNTLHILENAHYIRIERCESAVIPVQLNEKIFRVRY